MPSSMKQQPGYYAWHTDASAVDQEDEHSR